MGMNLGLGTPPSTALTERTYDNPNNAGPTGRNRAVTGLSKEGEMDDPQTEAEVRNLEREAYQAARRGGENENFWDWAESVGIYSIDRGFYKYDKRAWGRIQNAWMKGGGKIDNDDVDEEDMKFRDRIGTSALR